ncbi:MULTISPECIES: histidine kinase [unclassified Arenibacter]|uniref:histidine kinase n=1 Tax=unclassified Arenibacter TaxID=2615047 RepID=UPI000E3439A6|nr:MULTISPECIES: histidine kinase [unclassified Arenibacter]MCM4162307.1 histidine kinase [Arenibacter sp. A80]RFT57909.1 histidine kinase [Arenibacter sp. P308M17]
MKKIAPVIVFLLVGLCSLSAQIRADSLASRVDLVGHPEVQALRSSREESLEKILKTDGWKAYDSSFATTPETAIWIKFPLENTSLDTLTTYLFYSGFHMDLYLQNDGEIEHFQNGYLVSLGERSEPKWYFFTALELLSLQQSLCYIRIINDYKTGRSNAPILYSRTDYLDFMDRVKTREAPSIAFIYTYLISLCCILIFVLVFWFRLRKQVYFYYLGYLVFQILYAFVVLQTTLATVGNLGSHVPYLSLITKESIQFSFIGFYIFFILHLLEIKAFSRQLSKALVSLGIFCFVYALSKFIFNYYEGLYSNNRELIAYIVRLIVLPLNIVLFIWIILKVKHPLMKYFVMGQSLFFIGAFVSSYIHYNKLHLEPDGIFNFPHAQHIIFQAGLLGEVFCFSIALGEKVFLIQKEKDRASQKLIEQLQQNQIMEENMRKELDEQVQQKTEELIKLYSEMEKQKEEQIKRSFVERLRDMKMLALRSQMNPHFIFNSLNALKNLVMLSREEDAIQYLDNFSVLLRTILQNSSKNTISVEEELEMLELYLSLEKSRLGEDFSFTIQCNSREALSQYTIPPLLLQPFVENAIWHGLHPSGKPEKKLSVTFDTSQQLKITIEDNGVGRKESGKTKKTHPSAGTRITQERLSLYNHISEAKMQLTILDLENDQGVPEGTRITITYNE